MKILGTNICSYVIDRDFIRCPTDKKVALRNHANLTNRASYFYTTDESLIDVIND
jgi:hypothetical protein